jgi:predicted NodU family carbamoyl transferase
MAKTDKERIDEAKQELERTRAAGQYEQKMQYEGGFTRYETQRPLMTHEQQEREMEAAAHVRWLEKEKPEMQAKLQRELQRVERPFAIAGGVAENIIKEKFSARALAKTPRIPAIRREKDFRKVEQGKRKWYFGR